MRQRFRARELWLLLPFLLIGASAWYWGRLERTRGASAGGAYVSSVKVETAAGYYQERGYSHCVTVRVSHLWPKPKWWSRSREFRVMVDALHPEIPAKLSQGLKPKDYWGFGTAMTTMEGGKSTPLPVRRQMHLFDGEFDGTSYVFKDYYDLSSMPQEWGEVTLHGLFCIAGQSQVTFERQIRAPGETLPDVINRDPDGRLVGVVALPSYANSKAAGATYEFFIAATVRPNDASRQPYIDIYDVEAKIGAGLAQSFSTHDFNYMNVIPATRTPEFARQRKKLAPGERLGFVRIIFRSKPQPSKRVTIRGKVSLDAAWPLPFEIVLPPRS